MMGQEEKERSLNPGTEQPMGLPLGPDEDRLDRVANLR